MVKSKLGRKAGRKQDRKTRKKENSNRISRITAQTSYAECSERLTAFGGLLALMKFLDLIRFEEAFETHYVHPKRVDLKELAELTGTNRTSGLNDSG